MYVLLHIIGMAHFFCFTDAFIIEGFWHQCLEKVYWHHFSSICSLRVSVTFGNSCNFSSLLIIIILTVMMCGQLSLTPLMQLLGGALNHTHITVNLICKHCVHSDLPNDLPFLQLFSFPWASLFPETERF